MPMMDWYFQDGKKVFESPLENYLLLLEGELITHLTSYGGYFMVTGLRIFNLLVESIMIWVPSLLLINTLYFAYNKLFRFSLFIMLVFSP